MKNAFVFIVVIALTGACSEESYIVSTENTPEISTAEADSFQKGNAARNAPDLQSEWVEEVFIDYGPDRDSHAGPGPHPTTESSSFHLTQGGISWFTGDDVKYEITGPEPFDGDTEIDAAVQTIAGFVTTRNFFHNDGSPTPNPCGGNNRVVWDEIDGSGGILATTSVCRNIATKEIGGFAVTIDTNDSWATSGVLDKFDVENVVAHEFGHVAGLGHGRAPKDGCLTMYRFADEGETQKRSLGLGDKLGMQTLYGSTDVTPGVCGS